MYEDIQAANAEVLAISVDNLAGAERVVSQIGIPFPILYDPSKDVPRDYGVFNLLNDNLATPSTFVLDKEGVIRYKFVASGIGDRPPVSQILRQLADIQG